MPAPDRTRLERWVGACGPAAGPVVACRAPVPGPAGPRGPPGGGGGPGTPGGRTGVGVKVGCARRGGAVGGAWPVVLGTRRQPGGPPGGPGGRCGRAGGAGHFSASGRVVSA